MSSKFGTKCNPWFHLLYFTNNSTDIQRWSGNPYSQEYCGTHRLFGVASSHCLSRTIVWKSVHEALFVKRLSACRCAYGWLFWGTCLQINVILYMNAPIFLTYISPLVSYLWDICRPVKDDMLSSVICNCVEPLSHDN